MAEKSTQGNGPDDKAAVEPKATKTPPNTADKNRDADQERFNALDGGPAGESKGALSVDDSVKEVQENMDVETSLGYRGARMDPTPLHAYTVEGVTSGEPTPETDADAKAAALERSQLPAERLHEVAEEQQKEVKS